FLHQFTLSLPTRRSSDLIESFPLRFDRRSEQFVGSRRMPASGCFESANQDVTSSIEKDDPHSPTDALQVIEHLDELVVVCTRAQDRKSTRLNSSHVSHAY